MTLGKWARKGKQAPAGADADKSLAVDEREELERLRAENATLRMERGFAKKVATWFAEDQP